ncbi:hypothetical protein EHQ53_14130 [Leptospira langatensis]|uniref:Uncharacterized protein n=1 Tax=Leptospira langatensis TaxID=2484983 RepID=A0ABY2MCH6_9LEPT|nr:hypothetical protein [Leptospira langatensis]TGL39656.1 hypothetical protein EHQ53_14130 [Leptospira langatensis]
MDKFVEIFGDAIGIILNFIVLFFGEECLRQALVWSSGWRWYMFWSVFILVGGFGIFEIAKKYF